MFSFSCQIILGEMCGLRWPSPSSRAGDASAAAGLPFTLLCLCSLLSGMCYVLVFVVWCVFCVVSCCLVCVLCCFLLSGVCSVFSGVFSVDLLPYTCLRCLCVFFLTFLFQVYFSVLILLSGICFGLVFMSEGNIIFIVRYGFVARCVITTAPSSLSLPKLSKCNRIIMLGFYLKTII